MEPYRLYFFLILLLFPTNIFDVLFFLLAVSIFSASLRRWMDIGDESFFVFFLSLSLRNFLFLFRSFFKYALNSTAHQLAPSVIYSLIGILSQSENSMRCRIVYNRLSPSLPKVFIVISSFSLSLYSCLRCANV